MVLYKVARYLHCIRKLCRCGSSESLVQEDYLSSKAHLQWTKGGLDLGWKKLTFILGHHVYVVATDTHLFPPVYLGEVFFYEGRKGILLLIDLRHYNVMSIVLILFQLIPDSLCERAGCQITWGLGNQVFAFANKGPVQQGG